MGRPSETWRRLEDSDRRDRWSREASTPQGEAEGRKNISMSSIIVRVYGEMLNYELSMPASLKGEQVNAVTKQRGKIKRPEETWCKPAERFKMP